MTKNKIKISVRKLIEYSSTGEKKVWSFSALNAAREGTQIHMKVQEYFKTQIDGKIEKYEKEVTISNEFCYRDVVVIVHGRIDGIIKKTDRTIIQEIKTTDGDVNNISYNKKIAHKAQLKCYAYLYCLIYDLEEIDTSLMYYSRNSNDEYTEEKKYNKKVLETFFYKILDPYISWIKRQNKWENIRNQSIIDMSFPYKQFRKGQRNFAVAIYKSIKSEIRLFAQAPTGTGKTLGAMFPAIKAMAEGYTDKIFYLTAKTITRDVAQKSYHLMKNNGLRLRTLTITAKEKICPCKENACTEDECDLLSNFTKNVKKANKDILEFDYYDRNTIEGYALKHHICPFEFSLELSLYSDLIICDYNYLFDPRIQLKRFFENKTNQKFCFLVDEAHNLVDRARDMYSSQLIKEELLSLRRKIKKEIPSAYKALSNINKKLLDIKKKIFKEEIKDKNQIVAIKKKPEGLAELLEEFLVACDWWMKKEKDAPFKEELLETYFNTMYFYKVWVMYDERYVTFYSKNGSRFFSIKMYCVDPSFLLDKQMKNGVSSILFSATLSPMNYFKSVLGGRGGDGNYIIQSPFSKKNLSVIIDGSISTKYRLRKFSYVDIAQIINEGINVKKGNYMAFFPSFKYMHDVIAVFENINEKSQYIVQGNSMNELEREEFLYEFEKKRQESLVSFAVMGGIFGEGIDLVGDKLSGVFIIGVGLPQICTEREYIKEYFDVKLRSGFDFAYTYPGLNRVMQGAGRVIRSESDKGFIVLIDERFTYDKYKRLMPEEWKPISYANSKYSVSSCIEAFWNGQKIK